MRKLLQRFLGSPTEGQQATDLPVVGSTPAPGAEEYVQAEVVPSIMAGADVIIASEDLQIDHELLARGGGKLFSYDPAANVANRPKTAEENRAMMQAAYPMRGRFHCCDPRTVQSYNVDTGEARVDCVCELCGWAFQRQAYVPHPHALPADTTPPPLSADCHEPGGMRRLR